MIVEVCGISIKQWFSSICGPIGSMIEISSRESRNYDQGCILIRHAAQRTTCRKLANVMTRGLGPLQLFIPTIVLAGSANKTISLNPGTRGQG
ncbi:hypothetical protein TWF706_005807 [Orbilia oligospora]|nr:hypothetical protein TWF706_005807 [Orbilia oligospora]